MLRLLRRLWWHGCVYEYEGVPVEVQALVESPREGRAAVVVPAMSVAVAPSSGIITPGGRSLGLAAMVKSHTTGGGATVGIVGPAGWEVKPAEVRLAAPSREGNRSTRLR